MTNPIYLFLFKIINMTYLNSWCCCKEIPSMTDQNLDFFTCTTSGKSASCLQENYVQQYAREIWCNQIRSACTYCFCFKFAQFIQHTLDNIHHTELSCKQLCWFHEYAGKKSKIFLRGWWPFLVVKSAIDKYGSKSFICDAFD